MTQRDAVDRGYTQSTFQAAMLYNVTPELRAVTLDLTEGVRVRFVYAVAIADDIRDIVGDVENQIMASFSIDVRVESVIESIPEGPITISDTENFVFHRREAGHPTAYGWAPLPAWAQRDAGNGDES